MKTFCTVGLFIFLSGQIFAQSDSTKTPYDLNLEAGGYTKIGIHGLGFNFVLHSPTKKLSFAFRNRFFMRIEKTINTQASGQYTTYTDYFVIAQYFTLNYVEADYCWNIGKKRLIETGLGFGWAYNSEKENIKWHNDYGYAVLSGSVNYKVTWFYLEIRGDVPIFTAYKVKDRGPARHFPVTVGIFYRFKPKSD